MPCSTVRRAPSLLAVLILAARARTAGCGKGVRALDTRSTGARFVNFNSDSGPHSAMSTDEMVATLRREWTLSPVLSKAEIIQEARRRVGTAQPKANVPLHHARAAPAVPADPSVGCGRQPPTSGSYTLRVPDPLAPDGMFVRSYQLHVPVGYDRNQPIPLVLDFHAWGSSARCQLETNGMNSVADNRTVLVVYPDGLDDVVDPMQNGSKSWNSAGSTAWRSSALGPTCEWIDEPSVPKAGYPCMRTCQRAFGCDPDAPNEAAGCDSSTCADDASFVGGLLDALEAALCVDRRRVHATGMSNGAIMSYEAATGQNTALSVRFASIAPAAGAPLMGFNRAPPAGGAVALLDIRGAFDNICPANVTNGWPAGPGSWRGPGEPGPFGSAWSADGFYYTPIDNITVEWAEALGCKGSSVHYPTRFDGISAFHCVAPHGRQCSTPTADVVRCSHLGGHDWPWALRMLWGEYFFAELVLDFFADHPRPV